MPENEGIFRLGTRRSEAGRFAYVDEAARFVGERSGHGRAAGNRGGGNQPRRPSPRQRRRSDHLHRALPAKGYGIGDLNERNLLVTTQALVTLVDTDSFQVKAAERVFRCRVGSAEYTPPELQGARFADIDRGPQHDAFGLGVLIFQLLM